MSSSIYLKAIPSYLYIGTLYSEIELFASINFMISTIDISSSSN